ncbi:MAG: DUF4445 domain-containing protein [Lachnospiraceae bacterium]|nr:DUF4445 domain-containing protein [Lachnospiraceae bacterium]
MYRLIVLDENKKHTLEFEGTPTVQEVLEHHGIVMPHPCGGAGRCGKCVIEILGAISEPDEKENILGCRLSCRTRLYGDAKAVLCADKEVRAEGSTQSIKALTNNEKIYGAAVDIGTTTVALSVYHLKTGNCLATETMLNPQSTVAADVMGRIDAAMNGQLGKQAEMIVTCIRKLAEKTGYADKIDKWVITGNTTMLYLLKEMNPQSLAKAPFLAEYLFGEESTFLNKPLYLPECMHAFVGADITCSVLESGMCDSEETSLLCDIGTNGELALWKGGKLYTASTAAGPAFEGAGISCGCQSINGAIERVTLDGSALRLKTIGDTKPVGICGSGIIDVIACLLENGTVDETGAMDDEKVEICEGVCIQRCDIRAIQLAKAAIAAGIKTLLEVTDTKEEDISTVYIAGGFGSHLNIDSAIRIGLLQDAWRDKIKVIGNASLKGAASMLTDESLKNKAHEMISQASYVNLGGMSAFNENYIDEMLFPEEKRSAYMLRLAGKVGFSHYGLLKKEALVFRQEVRDMCEAGRCQSYGKRWTCPPHCGTLEESVEKVQRYNEGIILQMTGNMEDDFDVECMQETEQAVKDKLDVYVAKLKEAGIDCLPMSAGTCTRCEKCTCPDEPCRFPEKAFVSMEAYGLVVSDVCTASGVAYNYGRRTMTFTTCVLF